MSIRKHFEIVLHLLRILRKGALILVGWIGTPDKRRDHLRQFLKRFSADILHLGKVMAIEFLDEVFKEPAIAIHSHVCESAGRQQASEAIEYFSAQSSCISHL